MPTKNQLKFKVFGLFKVENFYNFGATTLTLTSQIKFLSIALVMSEPFSPRKTLKLGFLHTCKRRSVFSKLFLDFILSDSTILKIF